MFNFKNLNIFYSILFITTTVLSAQSNSELKPVYIKQVLIESEVAGPFSKKNIEIVFHNPNDVSNLEAVCTFETNPNSFVKELYLEMEDKYKKAETFSRRAGEKIYEKVTGKKLDPALLRTNGNGYYTLRVFPFNAHQSRRVKIELYSVLDVHADLYKLNFEIYPRSNIILNLSSKFPDSTLYLTTNEKNYKLLSQNIKIETNSPMQILFKPKSKLGWYLIQNKNERYYWNTGLQKYNNGLKTNPELRPFEIIEQIVHYTKAKQSVDATHVYWNLNQFAHEFIKYLKSKHGLEIFYESKMGYSQWEKIAGWWRYTSGRVVLDQFPRDENVIGKISCPFLDFFTQFNNLKSKTVKEQSDAGFLTYSTAKLVLEDDNRILKIRNNILEKEAELFDESIPPGSSNEEPIIEFYSLTDKPEVIHRADILYPEIAAKAGIEGMVVVKVLIDTSGYVERTEIIKSAHPVLNNAAITSASLFRFKPGMQRNKKVKVWMTIPFTFKADKVPEVPYFKEDDRSDTIDLIPVFHKKFRLSKIEGITFLIERGFNLKNAIEITYGSPTHFEFLYQHPDMIKYSYLFPNIALQNEGKWYIIK